MRGHLDSTFPVVADLQPGPVSGWGHVAAVATITVGLRDGGPSRGSRPGRVDRMVWTHPGEGGTRRLTSMNRSDSGPQGGMGI